MCALSFLGPVPDCQVHSFAPLAKHEAMNASDALVLRGGGFFMSRPDCQVTQVGIAMRIWILSESDTLADMIRRPLRRIRTITDKEIVVVASPPDHATLLRAMRAGASDYLSADSRLGKEIEDFLTRVRTDRGQNSAKGRIITVVPCD